ncbi:entry exclusion protein TrbK [Bradyrhizobium sp. CCGUVB23]|uniref:entry exclusion protein TrbK n=1 Tax=Bradyrhizobium sp. CCGUVB23 TaxID=2949630 RepID=UPI0020B41B59|nr:entry exclusion protein TrbK [Bradyrhizobium sp. CCGUVB23]MCP3468613.1 entry exclusion protein TrbK [Bradyrhizobium sp. CCGUVB23]
MRPFTIIIVIVIGAGAAGAWLFFAPHGAGSSQGGSQRAGDFLKPPQNYKTSGGQPMKPRW